MHKVSYAIIKFKLLIVWKCDQNEFYQIDFHWMNLERERGSEIEFKHISYMINLVQRSSKEYHTARECPEYDATDDFVR